VDASVQLVSMDSYVSLQICVKLVIIAEHAFSVFHREPPATALASAQSDILEKTAISLILVQLDTTTNLASMEESKQEQLETAHVSVLVASMATTAKSETMLVSKASWTIFVITVGIQSDFQGTVDVIVCWDTVEIIVRLLIGVPTDIIISCVGMAVSLVGLQDIVSVHASKDIGGQTANSSQPAPPPQTTKSAKTKEL